VYVRLCDFTAKYASNLAFLYLFLAYYLFSRSLKVQCRSNVYIGLSFDSETGSGPPREQLTTGRFSGDGISV